MRLPQVGDILTTLDSEGYIEVEVTNTKQVDKWWVIEIEPLEMPKWSIPGARPIGFLAAGQTRAEAAKLTGRQASKWVDEEGNPWYVVSGNVSFVEFFFWDFEKKIDFCLTSIKHRIQQKVDNDKFAEIGEV
jgi:hypothetical protein